MEEERSKEKLRKAKVEQESMGGTGEYGGSMREAEWKQDKSMRERTVKQYEFIRQQSM